MDDIDVKILSALRENARATASEIGAAIGMSVSAVIERIKKLEANGVIAQYTAIIDQKNVNKDILAWLEEVVEENNSRIERKEWKSKYNSYVVYDYEPFCTDGFEINLVITSYNSAYLNFIKYLYDEKISTIEYLNSCIGV